MKYKAVIFDFDNTLVASWEQNFAHHKHTGKKFYNLDFTDKDIAKHYGKPYEKLIIDLYQGRDTLENIQKAIKSSQINFFKKPYEHTLKTLENIISSGRELGVISATVKSHLIEDFSRLNFPLNNFFIMQGSDEVAFHKPDPKVFTFTLDELAKKGVSRKETVYVGDSLDDLQASHGAGINFIAITTGLYSKEEFEKAGAKVILSDIRELSEHI